LNDDERNRPKFVIKNFKKILDDDERNRPKFVRRNFEKILDDDERNEVTRKEKKNVKLHN